MSGSEYAAPPSPSIWRLVFDPPRAAERPAQEGRRALARSPHRTSAASARPFTQAPAAAARRPPFPPLPVSPPLADSPQSSAQEPRGIGAALLARRVGQAGGVAPRKATGRVAAVEPLTEAAYRRPRPTALPSAEQKSLALCAARRLHRADATTRCTALWDSKSIRDYKIRNAARVLRRHTLSRVSGSFSF